MRRKFIAGEFAAPAPLTTSRCSGAERGNLRWNGVQPSPQEMGAQPNRGRILHRDGRRLRTGRL